MGRMILGVVVGYVVIAAFVFVTFSLVYMALGTEGAFQANSYDVSGIWIIASIVLGFISAMLGGYVSVIVAKKSQATRWLAGLVLVLGIVSAVPVITGADEDKPTVRSGEVAVMDAMSKAQQPVWLALINPIIGVVGVMVGGCLREQPKESDQPYQKA